MNTKALVAAAAVAVALTVQAAEPPAQADILSPGEMGLRKGYIDWNDPKWWESMQRDKDTLRIRQSDYMIHGPVLRTFRRGPKWSELSLGQKIASLPIVNLVVPQPFYVEAPPRGGIRAGDYFKWQDHDQPWVNVSDRPLGPPGLIGVSY
jgi:hypothetical protein